MWAADILHTASDTELTISMLSLSTKLYLWSAKENKSLVCFVPYSYLPTNGSVYITVEFVKRSKRARNNGIIASFLPYIFLICPCPLALYHTPESSTVTIPNTSTERKGKNMNGNNSLFFFFFHKLPLVRVAKNNCKANREVKIGKLKKDHPRASPGVLFPY